MKWKTWKKGEEPDIKNEEGFDSSVDVLVQTDRGDHYVASFSGGDWYFVDEKNDYMSDHVVAWTYINPYVPINIVQQKVKVKKCDRCMSGYVQDIVDGVMKGVPCSKCNGTGEA